MIQIDHTLFFQAAIFLGTVVFLHLLVFRPFLRILREREKRIQGALEEAKGLDTKGEAQKDQYLAKIKDARAKANEMKTGIRKEALEIQSEKLREARTQAQKEVEKLKNKISASAESARQDLKNQVSTIAGQVYQKILGRLPISAIFIAFCIQFLFPISDLFAAGGEDTHHAVNWWQELLFPAINFAILLGILIYFLRRPLGDFFHSRHHEVQDAILEAKAAKQEAQAKVREYENKLKKLDYEIKQLTETFKADAEDEKTNLLKKAEELSAQIRENAKLAAEQELTKAQRKLKEEVVALAVELAAEWLKRDLNETDQEKLTKDYITNLPSEIRKTAEGD
jgi:F-type H+-transporting ATPase subunit b